VNVFTFSSREFNQDVATVKRSAQEGPVFITNRGEPEYVFLSIKNYQKITAGERSLYDVFSKLGDDGDDGDDDFNPSTLNIQLQEVEF